MLFSDYKSREATCQAMFHDAVFVRIVVQLAGMKTRAAASVLASALSDDLAHHGNDNARIEHALLVIGRPAVGGLRQVTGAHAELADAIAKRIENGESALLPSTLPRVDILQMDAWIRGQTLLPGLSAAMLNARDERDNNMRLIACYWQGFMACLERLGGLKTAESRSALRALLRDGPFDGESALRIMEALGDQDKPTN